MHRSEVRLHCANPLCQAPNPVSHRFCQTCRAPLTKQYLWLTGENGKPCQPGTLLGDRYWYQHDRVFLDTKPALLPESPEEISIAIEPYLRLITAQPRVPQVYAVLPGNSSQVKEWILLEKAPLYPAGAVLAETAVSEGGLMPEIATHWRHASSFRQLNWLWQLAHLWQDCAQEKVEATLLNPALIRVEGGLVRLLELHPSATALSLVDLGGFWQQWLPEAHPEIADFLHQLCHQLVTQQILTPDHLKVVLDQAIAACSQTYHYQIQIATLTDQGPTRQRNEDACAPASGSVLTYHLSGDAAIAASRLPYVVVCDGIGGHEGGNIASNLAIATLQQHFQSLSGAAPVTAGTLVNSLEVATVKANDAITQRNDTEQRHERQRMGTTLVMALAQAHEVYLAHIGDSRAYRITPSGCHQITLDDDLATREVRLGYALYREALRQANSGSLVQALGMNSSALLRPTIQRYFLDEDCIFLLCSDGLSDNDRVEQSWQDFVLPLLHGSTDPATVTQQLVAIANQLNGHDNATVGLVYCRVIPSANGAIPPLPTAIATQAAPADETQRVNAPASYSSLKTQNLAEIKPDYTRRLSPVVGLLAILSIGGLLATLLIYSLRSLNSPQPLPPLSSPNAGPTPPPALPAPPTPDTPTLAIGTRVLVNRSTPAGDGIAPILLVSGLPGTPAASTRVAVPVGSVLEIVSQQQDEQNQRWLGIRVCSVPAQTPTNLIAEPGERGWVQATAIAPFVTANVSLTPAQLGSCASTRQLP